MIRICTVGICCNIALSVILSTSFSAPIDILSRDTDVPLLKYNAALAKNEEEKLLAFYNKLQTKVAASGISVT